MANELFNFKEAWVCLESTFSTDPDTDGSDYVRLPAEEIVCAVTQEAIPRPLMRSAMGKRVASVIGGKGGTLTFKTPLVGAATAGAASVAAVAPTWLSPALKACGFTESAGTGTAVTGSGSTTTVIDVTSAAGISAGSVVMIGGEVREVTAANTAATPDNITVFPALSAIPSAATVVYAAVNYMLLDGADSGSTVAFAVKGQGSQETLLGCKGTVKIDGVDARGRPMLSWSFQIDSWADTSNKSSLPTTLGLKVNPLAMGSPFWLASTKTPIANFMFDPGFTVSPKPSTQGTQGRAGWLVTGETSRMTVRPYFDQTAQRTAFAAATQKTATMQFGAAHTETFAIVADQTQLAELPGDVDVNGMRAHDLVLDCLESSIADKPHFVIGVL